MVVTMTPIAVPAANIPPPLVTAPADIFDVAATVTSEAAAPLAAASCNPTRGCRRKRALIDVVRQRLPSGAWENLPRRTGRRSGA